jgi:tetratricopeptide (TPR) repeat protein
MRPARPVVIATLVVCLGSPRLGSGLALGAQAPDPALLARHAREGERALAEKRYPDAERAFEALRQLSPSTPEVHAQLGFIYFQEGKFNDAVGRLREAIRLKPSLPNLDTLLAMSLSELGQYTEALPALEKGFRQSVDPSLKRMCGLHLQRAYTGLARDRDAVVVALELSRLHPDDPEVLYHASRLLANLAYLQTMRLSRVAPTSVWMRQAAGEANESQGLYDAAIAEYREVLVLAPRRPNVHFRIGRALLSRARASATQTGAAGTDATTAGAADEAIHEFEQELEIDPTNANAAYEIGELRRKGGALDAARTAFERALTHYPEFEEALVGLGRTLVAQGQPALALPHLRRATTRNPANDVAWYQLAQAYGALGQSAEQTTALAAFTRLRDAREGRAPAAADPRRDVTKQELDPKPPRLPPGPGPQ